MVLLNFFKPESCALVINLFLSYSQFFYFIMFSLSILAKCTLKTPQLCFPEREQEKTPMAESGENRDHSALRTVQASASQGGNEHRPREREAATSERRTFSLPMDRLAAPALVLNPLHPVTHLSNCNCASL